MKRRLTLLAPSLAFTGAFGLYLTVTALSGPPVSAATSSGGSLVSLGSNGELGAPCPLQHTAVDARISGFLSRVTVQQRFMNPFEEKIEAVYTFPLPNRAAVDDMTIRIGERTVKGKIKRREEARQIYEQARDAGKIAALLDQERPNIFTQAVANIRPGEEILVEISYVETLRYEEGSYEFSFPTVVGPRYMPGAETGRSGGGWSPDTSEVPDASKISPPTTPPDTRAGHDLSIQVELDAGVAIRGVASKTHEVLVERPGESRALVRLKKKAVLPNKDFVLRYDVAGGEISDALLTHHDERGGFFTMILQPPKRVTAEDVAPKELVFVLDTSGSMSGFPIEKAKETMKLAIEGLYPRDTFNLITFAGQTRVLFTEPVPATAANLEQAQRFLASRSGGGGTEMMTAIRTALAPSDSAEHVRIVCFMTDGYIGNDMAILGEIQKHTNARVFSFGIGSSVNRFLLDRMAEVSRGEVEYVALTDDGSAAARRFHERIRNPLLTDIELDFGDLPVTDVLPKRIPDLFSAKPVVVTGRYTGAAHGAVRLKGKMSGQAFSRKMPVRFSADEGSADQLATLWARRKITNLMNNNWDAAQRRSPNEIAEQVTQLGLAYRLMTQYTSFVAVEETIVTEGGKPRRVDVPVEMPSGVSYEGVFGEQALGSGRSSAGGIIGGVALKARAAPLAPSPVLKRMQARYRDSIEPAPLTKLEAALQTIARDPLAPSPLVKDGAVRIEIWLIDATPQALAALKRLGFIEEGEPRVAKIRVGKLPASKLAELAALDVVRYMRAAN